MKASPFHQMIGLLWNLKESGQYDELFEPLIGDREPIDISVYGKAFALLEGVDKGQVVQAVAWSPRCYHNARKFHRDHLDITWNPSLLKKGYVASLWGATCFVSNEIPKGHVWFWEKDLFKWVESKCMLAKEPTRDSFVCITAL